MICKVLIYSRDDIFGGLILKTKTNAKVVYKIVE